MSLSLDPDDRRVPGSLSPELQAVAEITATVDGFLFPREGPLLYDLARACTGRGVIVEVGSWKGKSTIWLARGSEAGARVPIFAVDPHTGSPELRELFGDRIWTLPEFEENIERAGVGDLVFPLVTASEEAAADFSRPVELLFIDGAHDVASVRGDIDVWLPWVVEGGVVAMHDTGRDQEPFLVAMETLYAGRGFRDVRFVDTISYARKTDRPTVYDHVRGRLVLAVKVCAQAVGGANLPPAVRAVGRSVLRRFG